MRLPPLVRLGASALFLAAAEGSVEAVAVICSAEGRGRAELFSPAHPRNGALPLHVACLHGHADCALELLRWGANGGATDACGLAPLHYSAAHPAVLESLLQPWDQSAAVGPDALSAGGETALLFACFHGALGSVHALLDAGAATELADVCGTTPLHLAVAGGHAGCAEALLRRGASVTTPDGGGLTVSDLAAIGAHQHPVVARLLQPGRLQRHVGRGHTPPQVLSPAAEAERSAFEGPSALERLGSWLDDSSMAASYTRADGADAPGIPLEVDTGAADVSRANLEELAAAAVSAASKHWAAELERVRAEAAAQGAARAVDWKAERKALLESAAASRALPVAEQAAQAAAAVAAISAAAEEIAELQAKKEQAVAAEDYSEAARIKTEVESLEQQIALQEAALAPLAEQIAQQEAAACGDSGGSAQRARLEEEVAAVRSECAAALAEALAGRQRAEAKVEASERLRLAAAGSEQERAQQQQAAESAVVKAEMNAAEIAVELAKARAVAESESHSAAAARAAATSAKEEAAQAEVAAAQVRASAEASITKHMEDEANIARLEGAVGQAVGQAAAVEKQWQDEVAGRRQEKTRAALSFCTVILLSL
jgi:hypothetical protein